MTTTKTVGYIAFVMMAGALVGATAAQASEVTGTLSSDAASNTETSGNITGTVSSASDGGGGSSSGGSRSSGGRSNRSTDTDIADAPAGAVLGATADTVTPRFPNAGVAPVTVEPVPTVWSKLVTFFTMLVQPLY